MAWHTTLNMNVFPFFDISGFLYLTILDFLICKWRIFAQDTWIPNACPLRRGQINVNSNVSYKQTKQVDKETCKSQRAQNYLQNTRSDHQPPQSMLRGAFAWPLKAPFTVSIKKKIWRVLVWNITLCKFQGVPQNQHSEDIPLEVKSSS